MEEECTENNRKRWKNIMLWFACGGREVKFELCRNNTKYPFHVISMYVREFLSFVRCSKKNINDMWEDHVPCLKKSLKYGRKLQILALDNNLKGLQQQKNTKPE